MTYQLTVTPKPTYLHATVTGLNTKDRVVQYPDEILGACVAHVCFRVPIKERFEGPRLRILDVFEIVSAGSRKALGMLTAMACIDVHAEGDKT